MDHLLIHFKPYRVGEKAQLHNCTWHWQPFETWRKPQGNANWITTCKKWIHFSKFVRLFSKPRLRWQVRGEFLHQSWVDHQSVKDVIVQEASSVVEPGRTETWREVFVENIMKITQDHLGPWGPWGCQCLRAVAVKVTKAHKLSEPTKTCVISSDAHCDNHPDIPSRILFGVLCGIAFDVFIWFYLASDVVSDLVFHLAFYLANMCDILFCFFLSFYLASIDFDFLSCFIWRWIWHRVRVRQVTFGFLRGLCGISMVFLWDFHDVWYLYDISLGFLW